MKIKTLIFGVLLFIMNCSILVTVQAQEIPSSVRTLAEGKASDNKIVKWVTDKQREKYIAITAIGSLIEISLDGKWLRTTQLMSEKKLPTVLKNALEPYLDTNDIDNYAFVDDAAKGKYYIADLTPKDEDDGDDSTIYIDTNGKIVGKEKR